MHASNQRLKVLMVAHSFAGGAGRAAHRLFDALTQKSKDVDISALIGRRKGAEDPSASDQIALFDLSKTQKVLIESVTRLSRHFAKPPTEALLSPALVDTGVGKIVNNREPDVVNLHWLGHNTLSIREIAKIQAPIVWTLHDEWFYRGTEHYASDSETFRGYDLGHNGIGSVFELNRFVWNMKRRHWVTPMHLVSPSTWLAENIEASALGRAHTVHVIPNPLDTDFWRPIPRPEAAEILNLDPARKYVLSGSLSNETDRRKGRDLVIESLGKFADITSQKDLPEVLFFGGQKQFGHIGGLSFQDLGRLDDIQLRAAYSLADVMVFGSRQDNLPQTATESTACGTPVIAFNIGGLPDIVESGKTGILVSPFDTSDMAYALESVLSRPEVVKGMSEAAREKATTSWSEALISEKYTNVFQRARANLL